MLLATIVSGGTRPSISAEEMPLQLHVLGRVLLHQVGVLERLGQAGMEREPPRPAAAQLGELGLRTPDDGAAGSPPRPVATSVARTSRPWLRNSAAQLAPTVPQPTTATRRMPAIAISATLILLPDPPGISGMP